MRAVCAPVISAVALAGCSSTSSKYDELVVQTVDDTAAPFTGPVGGVQVQVNNQPWVATDATGKATFKNVDRPFTVRIYVIIPTVPLMEWSAVRETPGLDANPAVLVINGWTHYPTRQANIAGSVT